MHTIAEKITEVDRLMNEMDPREAREVLLEALRERYGSGNN
jgi:hypothetical protein